MVLGHKCVSGAEQNWLNSVELLVAGS